jgi:hypothetical protein
MPGVSLTFFAATYGIYPDEEGIEKETPGAETIAGIHRDAFEAGDAYTPTAAALN